MTVITPNENVDEGEIRLVEDLLSGVGETVRV